MTGRFAAGLMVVISLGTTACTADFGRLLPQAPDRTPDRSAFAALSASDRVLHAEALDAALDGPVGAQPVAWTGVEDDVRGSIATRAPVRFEDGLVCRRFTDRLDAHGSTVSVDDAACWSGGRWLYLRRDDPRPSVLGDAAWPDERTYTVQRGASLAAVARRTDVPLATLERLNPSVQGRLKAGTVVRLP